jgi:hypothetical protein
MSERFKSRVQFIILLIGIGVMYLIIMAPHHDVSDGECIKWMPSMTTRSNKGGMECVDWRRK